MRDDGAGGGRDSFLPPLPFFIPTLLARHCATFTRRNNFVVLSVWHRPTLLHTGGKEEEKEKSLLRLVGWLVGQPWQWSRGIWRLSKTFGGHPVAGGLWDTPQVAAKHLIACPPANQWWGGGRGVRGYSR